MVVAMLTTSIEARSSLPGSKDDDAIDAPPELRKFRIVLQKGWRLYSSSMVLTFGIER